MVLSEEEKNQVFFSNLLALSYPDIWKQICEILFKYGYPINRLSHTKDYWCRDYMPIQIDENSFVQFIYKPDYLRFLKKYQTNTDDVIKHIVDIAPNVTRSKLVVGGGDIVVCKNSAGKTWVVMTDKIVYENPAYSKGEITSIISKDLGGAEVIWLPWDSAEKFGHTDGLINFINGNSDKPSIMVYLSLYTDKMANEIRSRLKQAFDVHELSFSKDDEYNWAYVNLLRTRDFIIIPGLGTDCDKEAMFQIESLYPDYKGHIYQINIFPIVEEYGGAFNCMTWTVQKEIDLLCDCYEE